MTITLNSLSDRLLISVLFSSFPEVLSCSFDWNIFFCLLILPNSLCLFLCIRCISYLSQSWRSGLTYEMFCGAQKFSPAWPPEPGTQRVSPMWATCTLLLWQGCGCCRALVGRAGPQIDYGAQLWLLNVDGWRYCSASCEAWLSCKDGQGSQKVMPTGTNMVDGEF